MLGKTAGGLFWMFRYLERAENVARLLEAGWRIALTRSGEGSNEWQSILITAGADSAYRERHDSYDAAAVINFMLRAQDNPSSVLVSVGLARQNARLVRTALSREVWEATNEAYIALKSALARPVSERNLHDTLALIRNRTAVVRGMLHGTMLRNDIFSFARLGTFLERADNTARILDVKYYVLLPSATFVGSSIDNVQWEVILRAVSAARAFRWLNEGDPTPQAIAEFLILDARMPRSLAFCQSQMDRNLGELASEYGERRPCHDLSRELGEKIGTSSVVSIFEEGLHEFLGAYLGGLQALANQIQTDYRFHA
ncbi:alpha-E domain-containing protein [Tropicimonas sp. IMCC6043]|uniref:alpha-E domain-containing protein n=1 Tax=Tropicimonas sp. IMCC6043 TaxID=2510645 RepID=UPI00101D6FEF|nr:alpha-E domain-containing protein [Tropicimonas sp. IMCC6043]RYH11150.1 alpha-E domain-containing protein [Tropicimonas sp. IMCC6043]